MKRILIGLAAWAVAWSAWAQSDLKQLHKQYLAAVDAPARVDLMLRLAEGLTVVDRDSAMGFAHRAVALADDQELDALLGKAYSLRGRLWMSYGRSDSALRDIRRGMRFARAAGALPWLAESQFAMADAWYMAGIPDSAHHYWKLAAAAYGELDVPEQQARIALAQGRARLASPKKKLAREPLNLALEMAKVAELPDLEAEARFQLGLLNAAQEEWSLAMAHFRRALVLFEGQKMGRMVARTHLELAALQAQAKKTGVARDYAEKALAAAQEASARQEVVAAYSLLGQLAAERGDFELAHDFHELEALVRDSLTEASGSDAFEDLVAQYEQEKLRLENENKAQQLALSQAQLELSEVELAQARMRFWAILIGMGLLALVAVLLIVGSIRLRRSNRALEQAMADLRAAQEQLVQAEKLASLGQVTAGIAHEIRNPLNFVTNLSRLSVKMVDELEEEMAELGANGLTGEAREIWEEYAQDLQTNAQKVMEHGERANRIVTDMLKHAGEGERQMEATDLEELTREYLNVAMHSSELPAVDIRWQVAESLPQVKLDRSEVGRALLNVFRNALEAMATEVSGDQPRLAVGLDRREGFLRLRIRDNGPGIPEERRKQVFEPFFTTKSPDKGTGLGLSLAFDSIVKGHKGRMYISPSDPATPGTEMVIEIPI